MTVKLGTNPIAWSNDDMPELGGDTPLETCLREAREAGFAGIENGQQVPQRCRRPCRRRWANIGLELVSGWYSGDLPHAHGRGRDRGDAARISTCSTACGCKVMVFAETVGNRAGPARRAGRRPPGDERGRMAGLSRAHRPARRLDGRQRRQPWPSTITWAR